VKKKNTNDLQTELITAPDLSRFLSENKDNFIETNLSQLLKDLFDKKNISKAALAKSAGISEVYLYQIFSGGRNPSRNRTLALCIGLSASLEETQELLKSGGHVPLYTKNRRDTIIMYGIAHQMDLNQINVQLFAEGEETLY